MSDSVFSGRPMAGSEQVISTTEMAEQAGRVRAILDPNDPITQLRDHCKAFIENAGLSQHHRMMALPKLEEMIFWIRAGTAAPK